jgi:hypothetical protein
LNLSLDLSQHKLMPAEQMKEFGGTPLVIQHPGIQNFLATSKYFKEMFYFYAGLQKLIYNVCMLTCHAAILPATTRSTINPLTAGHENIQAEFKCP